MSWTTSDLDQIEAAILTLSKGEGVAQVMYSNGNAIRYRESSLKALLTLRGDMQRELGIVHRRVYASNAGRGR